MIDIVEAELTFVPGRHLGKKTNHLILVKDWDVSKLGFISSAGCSTSSSPLFPRHIPSESQMKLSGVFTKALWEPDLYYPSSLPPLTLWDYGNKKITEIKNFIDGLT